MIEVIKIILYAVALATAFPVGWFLAFLCKDELIDGKKWFKIIIYVCVVLLVVFLLVYRNVPVLLSLVYMIIISWVSLWKGKDKKFVKGKD